jgi:aspartokinase
VHKFGGASLATAGLYRTVGDLLIQEAKGRGDTSGMVPTMAIVSARGGMTDLLVKVGCSADCCCVAYRQMITSKIQERVCMHEKQLFKFYSLKLLRSCNTN